MNCMYETVASVFLRMRNHILPLRPGDYELCRAEENLEDCRATLYNKEYEVEQQCASLLRDALKRRQSGDIDGAKQKLRERKRHSSQLEKLRNSIILIDRQLDALRSRELDREIMESLKLSSQVRPTMYVYIIIHCL